MAKNKSWEPPLEFPQFRLNWWRKNKSVTKPVFVKYNGNRNRTLKDVERFALIQATNIMRGFKCEDLEVVDIFESVKAKGWVVVVKNKT